jgi:integrase
MALIEGTKDGRPLYRVRWNYHTDPATGRRKHSERVFRKRKDAEAFHRRISRATTTASERIATRQLLAAWTQQNADRWQLRTRKDYDQHARIRINPYLGTMRVAALTPNTIQAWRAWMTLEGHGPRVQNKSLHTLKAAIRWARSEGITENRMLDDVRGLPEPAPKPARPRTPSEVEQIARGCRHLRDATLIRVAAYSGLRWSELRGLQWGDVDFDTDTIEVRRSIDLDRTTKPPKSGRSRLVAVLEPGMRALREWHTASTVATSEAWVFPSITGRPLSSGWHVDVLPRIRRDSGIHFDPHELRDTYASILIQTTGIGESELTMWLGHSSVQLTVQRYAGLFAKRKTMLARKASAALAELG